MKRKTYSAAFKQRLVQEYLANDSSAKEMAEFYEVSERSLLRWVSEFRSAP